MIFIDEQEFLSKKTSDTIFVLGSGPSINDVHQEQWDVISKFNSIAFNWFVFNKFEPTFYLIREQANLPQRKGQKESIKNFIRRLNAYKNTTGIICDVSHHTKRAYEYHKDDRITIPCIVMKDDNSKSHASKLKKYMVYSPMERGLIHGTCTLYNILHLCIYMKYSTIVFVGVDLNNSQYFWLPHGETRHTVSKKGMSYKDRHAVADDVLGLVSKFKEFEHISMYSASRKSLLCKIIKHKNISEFKI